MSKKILHIAGCDKFIPPFIDFVKENFDCSEHEFLLTSGMAEKKLNFTPKVRLAKPSKLGKIKHYCQVVIKMHQADKVVLHSLFDHRIVKILFFMPWLLKKCYWVMWGGDLYVYQFGERNRGWKRREFFRRPVIKHMGHLITYIEGDVELAREWYGAKGQYHECIMYLSNVYNAPNIVEEKDNALNIQVGNSADPSNNHLEALEKLLAYKDENICIYVPLSYGDSKHAKKVIEQGKLWFGEKFIPLAAFMPTDEYLKFLGKIDIAVFNHKRQQAMGNTITLLGLGKTVYMRSDVSQWQFFKDREIVVFDIDNLNILEKRSIKENLNKVKSYFSKENLKSQYIEIFK
ncbi:TDP-N-acetylfucosamine:lipid II N-acetylfucosaminyltransferase [Psychrobacter sp. LV10R520-6]|uniref:TDP-N-acetylfucosamine:lipid II N-acetylfucosaminyltransferase n=1 Tax=Psychrobacter sp. LV10R520-6 TaxID=1415574 RepID=UPI0024CCF80C|nr:TDP-N-acetylfucosamine:lipid II N-acetylfucosaminyltransferase [Psychrobacter sp. LV10R520-6]SNT69965.1 4-alpha-L-fucosyltransferase glycosyl transferase group 56 [Psychrobacter sp. LV10R520-6]